MHPGKQLNHEMKAQGINSQSSLAAMMGIPQSVVSKILNGQHNITVSMALKLEAATGRPAIDWLQLQVEWEREKLRSA